MTSSTTRSIAASQPCRPSIGLIVAASIFQALGVAVFFGVLISLGN